MKAGILLKRTTKPYADIATKENQQLHGSSEVIDLNKFSTAFSEIKGWSERFPTATEQLDNIEKSVRAITSRELTLPEESKIFNAFSHSTFDSISVCLLGQDPYHQTPEVNGAQINQAMGLSFSVPRGVKIPPSLRNIYKELKNCYPEFSIPTHGDLSAWSERVLLLNTSLTVEHSKPEAHAKTGWDIFTSMIVRELINRSKPVVFLSFGKHAHKITKMAEGTHHLVVRTSHPSPLGATKKGDEFEAFLGSKCFLTANDFLRENNLPTVDWTNL